MLRWVIEHYRRVAERKVFFTHSPDRAWYIPGESIWAYIAHVPRRRDFWTQEFGFPTSRRMIYIPPRVRENTWIKNSEIIP
jgi:hypothetical protein